MSFELKLLVVAVILLAVGGGLMWWALDDCNCRCITYSVKPFVMVCHDLPRENR